MTKNKQKSGGEDGKKVFIDGGAHMGESIDFFRETFPDHAEYEIHSFEPNPHMKDYLVDKGVKYHQCAVWTKDEEREFYIGKYEGGHEEGSTLMRGKVSGKVDYGRPVRVPCIDLSQWIKDNFTEDDHIVLKLDVEGAEYPILRKMIDDGTMGMINEFYGEFHKTGPQGKIRSINEDVPHQIAKEIRAMGLEIKEWYDNTNTWV